MSFSPQTKNSNRFLRFLPTLIISILVGFIWFLILYGFNYLNFTNVDWIYISGGDVFQHQIGWEWFRQEPWRFPIGRIEAYGYPFGTFISYTDSIPLLALPIKLLDAILPQNFQYLGLWELISLIGQMLFGMLILGEFTPSYFKKILGASLLVLAPILLYRAFEHNSLTAQWILLAGIWLILLEYRGKLWRWAWVILFVSAILVQLYFVAMLTPLWLISLYFRYKREKNIKILVVDLLITPAVMLVIGYSIGLFSLSVGNLLAAGLGYFSWNLNGFFNPLKYSTVLNALPIGVEGQYEGFSYLGLGNLLVLPFAFFIFFKKDHSSHRLSFYLPFIIISIAFILFALSNKAFLNAQPLWDFQLPKYVQILFSLFRATGRFIWPVFYFLVLFGIISIIRNARYATLIIFLALLIQIIDIRPLYVSKQYTNTLEYQSPLQAAFWQAAAENNRHVFLIPASKAHAIYEPFALFARQNQLTLNWGYFSRTDLNAIRALGEQVWEELQAGQSDKNTIYVFWGSDWEKVAQDELSDQMLICKFDGYTVALSAENRLIQTDFELTQDCTSP